MRLYFAPCGIGLGHAGRCIAIANMFKNNAKILFSSYNEAVNYIRRENFDVEKVPEIYFYEKIDGTFDLKRSLSVGPKIIINFLRQIGAEIHLMEHFKPDVVISDSRLSSIIAARTMGFKSILILHQLRIMIPHIKPIDKKIKQKIKDHTERFILETLGSLWNLSNMILVPDFPPPFTIAKYNVVPSNRHLNKLKLIGPIIPKYPWELPTKDEIRKELRKKLGIDDSPLIFIAMSGTVAEKKYITEKLIKILQDFPQTYNVVLSRGITDNNNVNRISKINEKIIICDWVDDRYKLLKACDLLITRGGHNTVSEAIYYGKPMIIIPTPAHSEHQGIAKSAVNMKIAKCIQQYNLSKENLLISINEILNSSESLLRVKELENFASKFNALKTIYETINKII
jgi:UDP:flavonoid glycosyltransferase YjiC (YdhE family)